MLNSKKSPKVLMLHWAGADWQLIQPLLDTDKLPNLKLIVEQGMMGKLMSLSPMVSPMLSTSLATGQYGDAHNILAYAQSNNSDIGIRPINSSDLQASPLWQLVNNAGKKAIAVGWPASQPATVFDGLVVSDDFARAKGKSFAHWPLKTHSVSTSSLCDIMAELRLHPSEVSAEQILPFIPNLARIDQETDERLPLLVATLSRASSIHGAATWLAEQQDWDLLMVHFDFIEVICDAFLQYCAPRMAHVSDLDAELYAQVVDGAYQFMDLLLGRYLELVGTDTKVMLVSNHGYLSGGLRLASKQQKTNNYSRHFREFGIFTCSGPGINTDQLLFGATVLDIAPTVLTLLELPVDSSMPGKVLNKIFTQPVSQSSKHYPKFNGLALAPIDPSAYPELSLIGEWITLGYLPTPSSEAGFSTQLLAENLEIHRLNNLAKIKLAKKELQDSLVLVEAALEMAPDNIEARFTNFHCQLSLKNFSACQVLLDDLQDSGYQGPELEHLIGELMIAQGQYDCALPHLHKARQSDMSSWRLLERIGVAYLNAGQSTDAQQTFLQALKLNPDFAMAYNGLGISLFKQKQHKGAAEAFMRSLGLLYQQPETHLNLGIALAASGQSQQAQQAIQNALSIQPDFERAAVVLKKLQQSITKTMLQQVDKKNKRT